MGLAVVPHMFSNTFEILMKKIIIIIEVDRGGKLLIKYLFLQNMKVTSIKLVHIMIRTRTRKSFKKDVSHRT